MTAIEPLSPTYAHAREAFLRAAASAGARVTHHPHPLTGPEGEALAVDVAALGEDDAPRVALVVSATHGVEGYAGSALQRHWLQHHVSARPDDVRLVMIHGLNPYGFAWVRRVNEDNVDLNRNFIDWDQPTPLNDDYNKIAKLLVPTNWSAQEQERSFAALMTYVGEVGLPQAQAVISRGQYEDATGVFYGGAGPVWSQDWLRTWSRENLGRAERVAIIDLHTGLGEWGTAQLICAAPAGSASHARARVWWDDVVTTGSTDSVSAALSGDWLSKADELGPQAEVTGVAIEYGTVDAISVLQALRADARLHAYGDPRGPEAPAVRDQVRAAFADDDPSWIQALWGPFERSLGRAFTQLSA